MNSSSKLSRRRFLKTTAMGGAALTAAPARGIPMGANDRINVACIGLGARGSEHLNLLLQHRANNPNIGIVAPCDVYQKRLTVASRKAPGATTYVHYQEVRWHKIHDLIPSGTIGPVVAVEGTYSRNAPYGDRNEGDFWSIDPAAGPDASGDNHIDWQQGLGPAPQMPFNADRFFRFRKYWDYSGGIATDFHYHVVAPFHGTDRPW